MRIQILHTTCMGASERELGPLNHCAQATPGYAFCLFLRLRSGAPGAARSA